MTATALPARQRAANSARAAFVQHWPLYLIEAALLGLFMVSACAFTALPEDPASPFRKALPWGFARRALIGLAMGATAVALIYSRWGRSSRERRRAWRFRRSLVRGM